MKVLHVTIRKEFWLKEGFIQIQSITIQYKVDESISRPVKFKHAMGACLILTKQNKFRKRRIEENNCFYAQPTVTGISGQNTFYWNTVKAYIYIYMRVCVCVCVLKLVYHKFKQTIFYIYTL